MTQKKKPVFTQPLSHGFNEVSSETEGVIKTPRWVTALASLRYSDLFASGRCPLNLVVFAILTFPPSGSWEG